MKIFSITLVVVCYLSLAAVQSQDHWPQFRGPDGDGHSRSTTIPTEWGNGKNIQWRVKIHDKGWSSPVVWGKQVWLTTAREDGKEFFALCVDRETGKILYDLKLFTEEKPAFCHPFNSYASPTPVIEQGRIYVTFGTHGTCCLDTNTGKKIWERTDLLVNHWRGPGSSPIVDEKHLYLIFDGYDEQYVVALNKSTGKTVWRTDRNIKYQRDDGDIKKSYATPALFTLHGQKQLICPSAEATIAYEPDTGKEIWRLTHGGMNVSARPIHAHGHLYLISGHNGILMAVKDKLKPGKVSPQQISWQTNKMVPTRPSILIDNDLLFMVDNKGIASCLDARTGKKYWQERISGEYSASPVLAGGNIYFASQDGKVHIVKASKEFHSTSVSHEEGFMASPAIAGDQLFLRTKSELLCVRRLP